MCYPKPGPRCSAHAAAHLAKLKHDQKMAKSQNGPQLSFEERVALNESYAERIAEATRIYDSTPAGIKELQRRYRDHSSHVNMEYLIRMKAGIALRKQQLEAIKTKDAGDIKHAPKKVESEYGGTELNETNTVRKSIPSDDPRIGSLLEESNEWVNDLDPEEIEAAAWMTSSGSMFINSYLAGKHGDETPGSWRYSKGHMRRAVANLDSAMGKWNRDKPILVYRGINEDIMESVIQKRLFQGEGLEVNREEYIEKALAPGTVYESKVFMSTSVDPERAARFSTGGIVMEIVSKKAAPVATISAWSTTEREMLLPRNSRYQVTKVIRNAQIEGHEDRQGEDGLVIIQMIELEE